MSGPDQAMDHLGHDDAVERAALSARRTARAAEFFAAELAFEADPDDVVRDLNAGTAAEYAGGRCRRRSLP